MKKEKILRILTLVFTVLTFIRCRVCTY